MSADISQIASYASAKQYILSSNDISDGIGTHAAASLIARTVATTLCAPADVLKSRMQSTTQVTKLVHVARACLQEEGPRFLMKGWMRAWLRLTPHTVLTFIIMEQLKNLSQTSRSRRQEQITDV